MVSKEDQYLFFSALGLLPGKATKEKQPSDKELFEKALDDFPAFDKDRALDGVAGKGHRKAKPRHRGRGFEAAIDLHGMPLDAAIKELDRFLAYCQKQKKTQVLVIHGKGTGILRNGVREHLQSDARVAQWRPAVPQFGGDGAVLVVLRR